MKGAIIHTNQKMEAKLRENGFIVHRGVRAVYKATQYLYAAFKCYVSSHIPYEKSITPHVQTLMCNNCLH